MMRCKKSIALSLYILIFVISSMSVMSAHEVVERNISNSSMLNYWPMNVPSGNILDQQGNSDSTSSSNIDTYQVSGADGGFAIAIGEDGFFRMGDTDGTAAAMKTLKGFNGSNGFSIAAWYQEPDDAGGADDIRVWTHVDAANSQDYVSMYFTTASFMVNDWDTGQNSRHLSGNGASPDDGEWVRLIWTQNATGGTKVYINNTLGAECTTSACKEIMDWDVPSSMWIGAFNARTMEDFIVDDVCVFNITLTSAQRAALTHNTCNSLIIGGGPSVVGTEFTITAKNQYDSSISITNISIKISNSSFSFNTSTVNGTILVLNSSFLFDKLYNIEFRSNDTGGYFNKTVFDVNFTTDGTNAGTIFQSVLNLVVIDGLNNLTVNTYSAQTNLSSVSTTIGTLLIETTKGIFALNISSLGFDTLVTNYSILALQNNTLNITLGSIFNFNLIRESTNTVFDFNSTNSTVVNVFCPNQTIILTFNISSNISQIINCKFTLMQAVVDYGELGSYFRTLIPSFSDKNITWYLIDLKAGDTAIQRIINLLDLTGEFADSILTVKRSIGGAIKTMIEQRFDISSNVNLFLVKDALYSISIDNGLKDIVLGNLIPTEAGTQTITLPKLDFNPTETVLGDNISWSYTFNITQAILRLQYEDKTNRTDLVRFTIFNDTGVGGLKQLFQTESNNNASVTITFNQILGNTTYITELFVKHQVLINFSESKIFYDPGQASVIFFDGWTVKEQTDFKKWFTWLFLGFWGLMFTRRYMGIGMTSLVVWLWVFRTWKWIDVPDLVFGFVVLMAVVGWMVDAMRRN